MRTSEQEAETRKAQIGDTILLHFTEKLNDGRVIRSTQNKDPQRYQLGNDDMSRTIQDPI
ncbi:hypothetical protein H8E88_18255 [candidate division KSB1 bacterium]|nr:hypothetical protein [candidate division KSB1 bacterium]MBL7095224.1 hypothetical protein [candidate division KSB1 bacterium]